MKANVLISTAALAGTAVVLGQVVATPGGGRGPGGRGSGVLAGADIYDVNVCRLADLSQKGKVGSFPNGTVGLGIETTGQNQDNGVDSQELPWFESPSVHHPVIGQNLFRVDSNGRLEQIGMSWLKHAWFAVQGTSCGSCQSSGTGTILGIGCADTYGSGLNAQQYWLGPRWEVHPTSHTWMNGQSWVGSHFQRNPQGGDSGSHNTVEHRLRVRMGDLTTPDATYFYEAFYHLNKKVGDATWGQLVEGPAYQHNNVVHRQTIPSHNGNGSFSFSNTGPSRIEGPVVEQWGDVQDIATPDTDGMVYVSSRSVDLGGGEHLYEYVVYNHNVERELNSFAIEIPPSANITDVGFHCPLDGYWNAQGNFVNEAEGYDFADWTETVGGGQIVFTPPTPEGQLIPNNIRYGTGFTFWFTADLPPDGAGTATIEPYLPGTVESLAATVVAPMATGDPASLDDFAVTKGTLQSGNLASLLSSDDDKMAIASEIGFSAFEPNLAELNVGATSPHTSVSRLDVIFELSLNNPNGLAKVKLFNFDVNDYESVGSFATSTSDSMGGVGVADADPYVRDADGRVDTLIRTVVIATFSPLGFTAQHDLVEFLATP